MQEYYIDDMIVDVEIDPVAQIDVSALTVRDPYSEDIEVARAVDDSNEVFLILMQGGNQIDLSREGAEALILALDTFLSE